ncbi:hypothetical protein NHX12_026715 [Muraenolepis orangiensis]|uniref:Ig-like domain-containing protein n=1 Tax=Muraenolepis orangiensis TaxID=630683 RepID=A0A9Q0EMW4_9TELE|nr:hypothetical protein NHX12_026715 [Muraenolepis orangiensis]
MPDDERYGNEDGKGAGHYPLLDEIGGWLAGMEGAKEECSEVPRPSSSDPPTVEPAFLETRQGLSRPVVMTCRVLRAHPSRVLRFEWRLSNRLLHAGAFTEHKDQTEYTVRSLNREGWGEYTCNVINEAGTGKCTFHVTRRTSD